MEFTYTVVSANLFPNPYRTLTKVYGQISQKLLGKNLKYKYIFYRTDLALSEYTFTFSFCWVVIEKFCFKVTLRYGTHTTRKQVRWNYCISEWIEIKNPSKTWNKTFIFTLILIFFGHNNVVLFHSNLSWICTTVVLQFITIVRCFKK